MILITSIDKFKKIYFLPLLLLHLILLINTKYTLWPEMVVYPYLLNNGFVLYKDLINPYLPTFTYILSLFTKLFGYYPENFRVITWIYILFIDLLIFKISLQISKNYHKAALSLLFFVAISIPLYINGLWFDLIQAPFIVLSIYYFYKFINTKNKKSIQAAFFYGIIAVFIKQQAVWLIIFYVAALIYHFKEKSIFWAKTIVPVIILFIGIYFCLVIIFVRLNAFLDFFFWTTYFPFFKASSLPGYLLFPTIKQAIFTFFLFAYFIPLVREDIKFKTFILGALSATLFAYPRFDYFHLVPALSVLSLVAGEAFVLHLNSKIFVKMVFLTSFVILSVFSYKYFKSNWTSEIRFFETEIQSTATFLTLTTSPTDVIYIQNGPDQLLPLSRRLPPKPWAIQFPWYLELNGKQQRIVDGIIRSNTTFIVAKPYGTGKVFDLGTYKPDQVASYIENNYHVSIKISDSLWLKEKN